jgi:hypothetical protein
MTLPHLRFTIGRLMVAAVAAATLLAWIRADVQSLVGSIVLVAIFGPVFAGISLDRSRDGWGIKGGAIGGSVSLGLIFVALMAWYVVDTGGKDLDLFEVSCVFGMMVGGGAAFGAMTGTTAAFCRWPGPARARMNSFGLKR